MMDGLLSFNPRAVLDCMDNGVCVTDIDRRILYWNKAAEQITNWAAKDIVGRTCCGDVLCHIDRDGQVLCGGDFCPLQRAIDTGSNKECPLLFVKTKDARRIPVEVTVAPLRSNGSEIIGGVEVFCGISPIFQDLENARAIQARALEHVLPQDARVRFATLYIPHDMIGGDFYAVQRLGADQYGFFLADMTGHGVAAALHTMYLRALWDRHHPLVRSSAIFAAKMNHELSQIVRPGESFAAGICGAVDLLRREVRFTGAGSPPALWLHTSGEVERLSCSGVPLGVMQDAPYNETKIRIRPGDCLLFFSDGIVETANAHHRQLGIKGFIALLQNLGYPNRDVTLASIEADLRKYAGKTLFEDDQTLLEIRFTPEVKE
jgi:phosphoserine phosphatase RsbU/P